MLKYVGQRLLMMIPVLLGVALIIFTMLYISPGEPADFILGDLATDEAKQVFNELNGLNDPFFVRYIRYVGNALTGDLGTSYITKKPVMDEVLQRFPKTLQMAAMAMAFATVVGVTLGVISATKQYSVIDNITRIVSIIGVSMPSFWIGLMLILLFSVKLRILPASGYTTPKHWILPMVTIGMSSAASIMRITRSSMLESIRQDYIRTARAKGQIERKVIIHHALRNSMIPIMTTIGTSFGKLFGGMAISESVFAIPGIGKMIVDAIPVKNTPVVQGGILFIAFAMSIVNLITDVLYAYVDPRIKSQYVRKKSKKSEKEAQA